MQGFLSKRIIQADANRTKGQQMITIDQLLESVDLDFEPRFVTKDEDGDVYIFQYIPESNESVGQWITTVPGGYASFGKIKLSEFDGKDWTECIYEVPRKTRKNCMRIINTCQNTGQD